MASPVKFSSFLLFACSLFLLLQGTQGFEAEGNVHELECEAMDVENCVLSANTDGYWCVLAEEEDGRKCITSKLQSEDKVPYLEEGDCRETCGVDTEMIGLPTPNSMIKSHFLERFCSKACGRCQNVQDAYLAFGQKIGLDMLEVCKLGDKAEKKVKEAIAKHHRSMEEVETKSPAPAPGGSGGARPVSEMASSLWEAATGLFESAKSPSASKTVDNAMNAVASSPSVGDAIDSAFNAAAPGPSTGASGPSGGDAAAAEDDYSA